MRERVRKRERERATERVFVCLRQGDAGSQRER